MTQPPWRVTRHRARKLHLRQRLIQEWMSMRKLPLRVTLMSTLPLMLMLMLAPRLMLRQVLMYHLSLMFLCSMIALELRWATAMRLSGSALTV